MSLHTKRALEPSSSTTWLVQKVRRHSEQAFQMPAVMAIDESTLRFQGTAWQRRGLPSKPEGTGVQISSILYDYNTSYGGVDIHDRLMVPHQ